MPKPSRRSPTGSGPQPVIEGTPAEVALNQEGSARMRQPRNSDNGGRDNNGRNGGHDRRAPMAVTARAASRRDRAEQVQRRQRESRSAKPMIAEADAEPLLGAGACRTSLAGPADRCRAQRGRRRKRRLRRRPPATAPTRAMLEQVQRCPRPGG